MPLKLPKGLLYALGLVAVVSFVAGMLLEQYQLDFLQAHPISVNLISSLIGFSTGALVVGYGFNWLSTRYALREGLAQRLDALADFSTEARAIVRLALELRDPTKPQGIIEQNIMIRFDRLRNIALPMVCAGLPPERLSLIESTSEQTKTIVFGFLQWWDQNWTLNDEEFREAAGPRIDGVVMSVELLAEVVYKQAYRYELMRHREHGANMPGLIQ